MAQTLVVVRGESKAWIVTEITPGRDGDRLTEQLAEPLTAAFCDQWLRNGNDIREGFFVANRRVLLVQSTGCWHAVSTEEPALSSVAIWRTSVGVDSPLHKMLCDLIRTPIDGTLVVTVTKRNPGA